MEFKHTPQAVLDCVKPIANPANDDPPGLLEAMHFKPGMRQRFNSLMLLSGCELDSNGHVFSKHVADKPWNCSLNASQSVFMKDVEGHFRGVKYEQ